MRVNYLGLFLSLIFCIGFVSSAHYLIGNFSNNTANGLNITIYSPTNQTITDIIGENGMSQTPNYFMLDCEEIGCNIGENYRARIFNDCSNYYTDFYNVTILGGGSDSFGTLELKEYYNFTECKEGEDMVFNFFTFDLTQNAVLYPLLLCIIAVFCMCMFEKTRGYAGFLLMILGFIFVTNGLPILLGLLFIVAGAIVVPK
jgi:hypothetical protein